MRLGFAQDAFNGTYARQMTGENPVGAPAAGDGSEATPPSPGRSRNMAAIRRVDTKPELALRSALHRRGYRFRRDLRLDVSGHRVRPDIVFTRRQVAVFVDGCFWHGCPDHGRLPRVNEQYWTPKLTGNIARDQRNVAVLAAAGWSVVRIWEHEAIDEMVQRVESALRDRH